jgi:hypothetical protein
VLAVRTEGDLLRFSKMIYTETNYLFYITPTRFRVEELDEQAAFQACIHKDILSDNKVFYLQNTDFNSDKTILGDGNRSLFQLMPHKMKIKKQSSFFIEQEECTIDCTEIKQDEDSEEIRNWKILKSDLIRNSVDITGKIDYLFPVRIETYEIIRHLLLHFPKMHKINYMLIKPEQIENASAFFRYMDLMTEEISAEKKIAILNAKSE